MSLKQLNKKRAEILGDLKNVLKGIEETENDEVRKAGVKKFDALIADVKAIDENLKRQLKLGDLFKGGLLQAEGEGEQSRDAVADQYERRQTMPVQPEIAANASARADISLRRHPGTLRAFKGEGAEEKAHRAGLWAAGYLFGDDRSKQRCLDEGIVQRGQNTFVNEKGGFLVPTEIERAIVDNREKFGVMRNLCNVMPMTSDTLTFSSIVGGITAEFVGEGQEGTESDMEWVGHTLVAKKIRARTRISDEFNEDTFINVGDVLVHELSRAFGFKEDDTILNGDGTSAYGGIVGIRNKIINGNHAASAVVAASGHDTFAEIDATDLAAVMARCPEYAKVSAKWICSSAAYESVFSKILAASGGNTASILANPMERNYLGYPIRISQKMPLYQGDLSGVAMLLFGDISMGVAFGDRRQIMLKTSEHVHFDSDQIAVKGTERFDVNVHDLGDGTTAGPIVALIGE